jgi:hypothetical protein
VIEEALALGAIGREVVIKSFSALKSQSAFAWKEKRKKSSCNSPVFLI